jgi:hypothetical protein
MNVRKFTGHAVFGIFPNPRFMPCPDCGASVARGEQAQHTCTPDRKIDYELFQLRYEVAEFDAQLTAYLTSLRGCFDVFYAARRRPPLQET